ncbi:MAG: hypothetical protein DA328_06150 [Nitrososphaeraceae archaeon]|nr:hypothetical protein [Nitrososphaeraceae archaeon]
MLVQQKSYRLLEMDKKRWIIRLLILSAIGIVLSAKFYFMIFVVDFLVGLYSFLTTFILFSLFVFAYFKYKDPYIDAKDIILNNPPLVSVIIPVRNEESNIRNCVQSCLDSGYSNKEIIVVNDASTDETPKILDELKQKYLNVLNVIHLTNNVGKKYAIEAATKVARGNFYVFMDSDCNMAYDAVENIVKIFLSDNTIGAVTGHGKVRDAEHGNILQKIQDVWFDGQFRILKGMESSFSSLTCCSGALSAFRREAVHNHMHDWATDRFIGTEFRFATDRRLTAFVLDGKTNNNIKGGKSIDFSNAINTRKEIETDNSINDVQEHKRLWKLKYTPSVKVYVGVPETLKDLIKQQIRWRKSFIRSIFATGGIYWKRPFPAALLYYLILALKLFRPFIVIKALILLPLAGDVFTGLLYISGALFSGMMYGIDVRLRNPGYPGWLYRPLMTLISTFLLSWLIIYAAFTIKNKSWR